MPEPATPRYEGPSNLARDMDVAYHFLAKVLTVTTTTHNSHTQLKVNGFGPRATLVATAVYLVGSVAQCIEASLQIRQALFDDGTRDSDLLSDILEVVGEQDVDEDFKAKTRDPWMWEAVCHLLIHLARSTPAFHPSGFVLAKTAVKFDVHDHGLDLIAIYEAGELGITAGESKAYLTDPARAITDASSRLREVDASSRDSDLRATVSQLRPSLSAAQSSKLGGTFWRNERTYYPFVCCDISAAIDWTRDRKSLRELAVATDRKFLVPFSIPNARAVYDEIAEIMRLYPTGKLIK